MKNFTFLFKESLEMYKQKLKPILILLLIYVVGIGGIMSIVPFLYDRLSVITYSGGSLAEISLLFLEFFIFIIFLLLFGSYMGASYMILIMRSVGTSLSEVFKEAWKKLWGYLLITILIWFFIILAYFFFFIPGVIISVYLAFSAFVFIDEGKRNMDALKRSWSLVKSNWWKVFGRVVSLNIVLILVFTLLGRINNLTGSIFSILSMPFAIIFIYLIYLELKKSKEIESQISTQA